MEKTTFPLNVLGAVCALLRSIHLECPVYVPELSLSRDLAVLQRRADAEGLFFLLTLLPRLGKAVDRALETGVLEPVQGFRRAHNSELPAFMQDVLRFVFKEDGTLHEVTPGNSVSVGTALRHIRTVCFFAYKLDIGLDGFDEAALEAAFIATDESLPSDLDDDDILETAAYEAARILGSVTPVEDLVPRHGPGAVAGGEVDEAKWLFDPLPLKTVLRGLGSLFYVNHDHAVLEDKWAHEEQTCSRIAFVPKDSRGPRIIAIEPKELQWLQQAIRETVVPRIERNTEFRVNFVRQDVNQRLALRSSVTREYATLDMKDASDRVSVALARKIIPPEWYMLLDAVRSEATRLPSGRIVQLKKLSSMGSATTFPVEALVFWTLSVAAISQVRPGSRQWIRDHVYVYGDDLIVPAAYATHVMDVLERYGLLVNRTKSFITGFFRESCGVDAYHGVNVTPIRMRKPPPNRRADGELVMSFADLANRLDIAGYTLAAGDAYSHVESLLGRIPFGTADCGYVHRHCGGGPATAFLLSRAISRYRWNRHLQLLEMRVWHVEKRSRQTTLDGWSRLLRNLTRGGGLRPDHVVPTHGRLVLRQSWRAVTR